MADHLQLSSYDVRDITEKAREKLGACQKSGQIVGMQVFTILEHQARVLYYPLGREAPWAFVHVNGEALSKPFVVLNTSRPVGEQVFGAAHELYHIWFDLRCDIVTTTGLDRGVLYDEPTLLSELRADRFAAEFLVDEHTLRREMDTYGIDKNSIDAQAVLFLSGMFYVPYRAMTRRLFEIDLITKRTYEELDVLDEGELARLRIRYGIEHELASERVRLDNLVDLSLSAYERDLITFEKLEYLLSLNMLTAEDVGIVSPEMSRMPSDS